MAESFPLNVRQFRELAEVSTDFGSFTDADWQGYLDSASPADLLGLARRVVLPGWVLRSVIDTSDVRIRLAFAERHHDRAGLNDFPLIAALLADDPEYIVVRALCQNEGLPFRTLKHLVTTNHHFEGCSAAPLMRDLLVCNPLAFRSHDTEKTSFTSPAGAFVSWLLLHPVMKCPCGSEALKVVLRLPGISEGVRGIARGRLDDFAAGGLGAGCSNSLF